MKFEITETQIDSLQYMSFGPVPTFTKIYTTRYDVVRIGDRKVIKSFDDLLKAAEYKHDLEVMLSPVS